MVELVYNPQNYKELLPNALDILNNSIKNSFTTKRLRNDILCKEYSINIRGRRYIDPTITEIGRSISYQLRFILTILKKKGYIEKINTIHWKKLKEIDLSPKEFVKLSKITTKEA